MKSTLLIFAAITALSSVGLAQKIENPNEKLMREQEGTQSLLQAQTTTGLGQPALVVSYGGFRAYQVNVTPGQQDTIGDAANEPSIAVNPRNPLAMEIGWRQFDNAISGFRQAGCAWSSDGGRTWHSMPPLSDSNEPQFRSDPVLTCDANGHFYYDSYFCQQNRCQIWNTENDPNWLGPINAWGGDKSWLACDTNPKSPGFGNLYQCWSDFESSSGHCTFSRSVPNAVGIHSGWDMPVPPSGFPSFGMVAVGPSGEVYDAGISPDWRSCVITRSDNAKDKFAMQVNFGPGHNFDLGGMLVAPEVNSAGLAGMTYCQVAGPASPFHGTVYCLASVGLWDQSGKPDATNVHTMFVKSLDGGRTFTEPVRVDAPSPSGPNNTAWFGTLSIAPNGRLDVVYNSTGYSDSYGPNTCVTLYTYSLDSGDHWSKPVRLTPAWDPSRGYPGGQSKIGDYYTTSSANDHVDLAFSATFSGGQDVYYMRIPAPANSAPKSN
ncbi:MAG: exo-alpha-sialidase [Armatimonadetes bacterium]|nr:exo-alpha-sialidase [Armatimonadota bacterium]